jgi:MbtH protein
MSLDNAPSYVVLVNAEEQYSLWPGGKSVPSGWRQVKDGSREECLAYVGTHWTDMRPLSLRKKMQTTASS